MGKALGVYKSLGTYYLKEFRENFLYLYGIKLTDAQIVDYIAHTLDLKKIKLPKTTPMATKGFVDIKHLQVRAATWNKFEYIYNKLEAKEAGLIKTYITTMLILTACQLMSKEVKRIKQNHPLSKIRSK